MLRALEQGLAYHAKGLETQIGEPPGVCVCEYGEDHVELKEQAANGSTRGLW
jgi:hypothetical protein